MCDLLMSGGGGVHASCHTCHGAQRLPVILTAIYQWLIMVQEQGAAVQRAGRSGCCSDTDYEHVCYSPDVAQLGRFLDVMRGSTGNSRCCLLQSLL